MKSIALLLFLLHALFVRAQVPEMLVGDSTILRAIDIFLDSVRAESHASDKFIIAATIKSLQVTPRSHEDKRIQSDSLEWPHSWYYWSYELSIMPDTYYEASNFRIAACKFHYRNRDVYLYFGLEYFVKYSEQDLRKLARKVPRVVPAMKVGGILLCQIRENKIISTTFVR